jgi:catechol 2,3-dioxygenase-like lactoylglutathione lyase family enzyme
VATHIDHVVLWVEDAHRALHFYASVVGLPTMRAEEFSAGTAPFPGVRVSEVSILDLLPTAWG